MNDWLYLTPQGLAGTLGQWPSQAGRAAGEPLLATLEQQVERLRGHSVQLVLPVEMCAWFLSPPWPGRRRPSVQAIGYAIEEQLASELDDMLWVVGARDEQRRYRVWATGRQRYQALLALLAEGGVSIGRIYVDADLLPIAQPCAFWLAERWLIGGRFDGRLALATADCPVLSARLPADLHWLNSPNPACDLTALLNEPHSAVDWLGRRSSWSQVRWQPCAWVLAVAGVAWVALILGRALTLEAEAIRLEGQNIARFQAAFPGQPQVFDLAAQLRSVRPEAVTPATRTQMLATLADKLLLGSNVRALRAQWQPSQGWRIHLEGEQLAELERLAEISRQAGLPLVLETASQSAGRVSAIFSYEEPAS